MRELCLYICYVISPDNCVILRHTTTSASWLLGCGDEGSHDGTSEYSSKEIENIPTSQSVILIQTDLLLCNQSWLAS